jgi:inosine-uridine nucleoside N-ribohydrolase
MSKLHVDTDIGGDIDDLCALAMVLDWPESQLVGVTTVADDQGKRAGYVHYILGIAGCPGVPVAAGAEISSGIYRHWRPGFHPDERAYWRHPVNPAPTSDISALDLLERSINQGATIAAIGPYTNLALLERRSPGILASASLVLMGGFVFPPKPGLPQWGGELDYNMQVDPESARIVLQCADPILVTLSVTLGTALRRS